MTQQVQVLMKQLDAALFRYAHTTGALEFYMTVLENPELQRATSKVIAGSEIEWKEIHRFMVVGGQKVTWYPELPVQVVLAEKNALLGFIYGITLSRSIGDLDFYLASVLQDYLGHVETSGSSWDRFIQKTAIPLGDRRHGTFVYGLLQERHKIEHNQGRIDRVFLDRMAKRNIQHAYQEGDAIQKSHIDVLLAHQAIREFAEDVDHEVSTLPRPGGG
jgi:hypothetical protein